MPMFDTKFPLAILERVEEMTRNAKRSSSSELVTYCQLIARAKDGTPPPLKDKLGTAILNLFEEFEVSNIFGRDDIRPGLEELGMTPQHLVWVQDKRRTEAANRKKTSVAAEA